jgi:hypothetical protein
MSDLKLEFLHIPKTGGTSLKRPLREKNAHILAAKLMLGSTPRYPQPISNGGGEHKFASEICGPDVKSPRQCFTFLRNPVDRCYSYMMMAKRSATNPYHEAFFESKRHRDKVGRAICTACGAPVFPARGGPLGTCACGFTEPPNILGPVNWGHFLTQCFETSNAMCHRVSHRTPAVSRWGSDGAGPIEADWILHQDAIENLHNFFYVGFFENYANDVNTLMKKIDKVYELEPPTEALEIEHLNESSYEPMTDEIREQIIEANKYDIMLYEYAQKHFGANNE